MDSNIPRGKFKNCGGDIPKTVNFCLYRGAKHGKLSICRRVGVGITALLVIGFILSLSEGLESASTALIYNEGDTVRTGYMSYAVWYSSWSSRLSSNEKPDAMFLLVKLTVRNDDVKARSVPPFQLIDENGAEYETSSKGWAFNDVIGVLERLNPGVLKEGFIIFDIPQNHKYKLKVSGGYWSDDYALIKLSPNR